MRPARASYDAVVIGGGHNGLVAAAYLARSGASVLVLERREAVGGAATTRELWPGYNVSMASYVCSLLHPDIVTTLDLRAHGYDAYRKDPSSFTPMPDGRSLLLSRNDAANARAVADIAPNDVAGFAAFDEERTRLGTVLAGAFDVPDPRDIAIDSATLQTLEGSAAALVERYVHTPVLQAELVNDGLIGTYAGPRNAGTAYVLAYHNAGRAFGVQGAWGFVRGGMGSISRALASAATAAGAEIVTGAAVSRIAVRDGRATAVVLADGSEVAADAVLSNADPVSTFRGLLDAGDVPAELRAKVDAWKIEGCSLKLNLALGELPNFTCRPGTTAAPHHLATLHLAQSVDYLQLAYEDARAGGVSRAPLVEGFMQTPTEPEMVPPGKHVLSIFAQYFPYNRGDGGWTARRREEAADVVVAALAQFAPNIPNVIEHRQVLAAPDIESDIGMTGGHIFHGELLPGQILRDRFAARTAVAGLYLCGSGAHPGGCVSGIPGRHAALAAMEDLRAHKGVPA
jgi:phytoene dehydrogenase-like protein